MPLTKTISNTRTIVEYTVDELKELLGLDAILAVYPLNGKVEFVVRSDH